MRQIESVIKHASAVVNDVVNDIETPERICAAMDAPKTGLPVPRDKMSTLIDLLHELVHVKFNEGACSEASGSAETFIEPELWAKEN